MKYFLGNRDPNIWDLDLFDFPVNPHLDHNIMKTDIIELEDGYEMHIDLPGVEQSDIKIDLKNQVLNITAEIHGESQGSQNSSGNKCVFKERHSGKFSRNYHIGSHLRKTDIKAKLKNGVLIIKYPKNTDEQENTSIEIEN